jgi:hypothetical protein
MLDLWSRLVHRDWIGWKVGRFHPLVETYEVLSSASVEDPLLTKTNVPYGLIPKPGLIYQAVGRLIPLSMHIFVERVQPGELLSVRIMAMPGVEERVTYRVESTLCGTRVSYSVTLKGWLSPIVWSVIRPYAARVAQDLAHAAEQERLLLDSGTRSKSIRPASPDLLGVVLVVSIGQILKNHSLA